ncbi:AraC family transcriptional regulator [Pseudoxanthomonas wuyuanensis]|uniref:Transcriptional regulator, AraC family n=1 Tax=Pseudoxanthomonas wuyuanensis TaxID=1073196 RepID=A0A286DFA7_9GAMM|nr:AraC family transcriptional regulator [Pseudoxanthomonas wuyuanensis]KAF1719951.1 AraC family transcriptional regulator [Pseudoxanthomonas wuyuanensis]SOD57264.1 transcriptional regulator, AraC family [Pseudoxanthomonas wuyuanensis]
MDALSEAMRAVRVTGALFFNGEFAAPWRFATPAQEQIRPTISPDSERLVLFHLVTEGCATARTAGHDEVSLQAGDMVVFPHGDAHEMWHGRTSRLFPGTRLLPKLARGELAAEKWGGDGPVTRIICGYLGCERHAEGLFLSGLPAIFKTNVRSSAAGAWVESAIRHCVSEPELQQAGRLAVLAKLAEALFVETLCRYMDELPAGRTGWLAGARDAKVGQALALLHRDPARAWTLPELARASGTSRTVLADRFAQLMGEPPLAYLARWRLQLGARRLLTTNWKVLRVAQDVGYESEAAFNRAFRRTFGTPPGQYRRERKAGQPPATAAEP